MIVDDFTDRLLGELRHISTVRAVDLLARYSSHLDMEAMAFFCEEPGELTVVVTSEGYLLQRTASQSPPLWEQGGRITSWTVELCFEPEEAPDYLGGGRLRGPEVLAALLPVFDAWAAAGPMPDGTIEFAEAEEAVPYAEDLRAVAAEHGMDAAVVLTAQIEGSGGSVYNRRYKQQRLLRSASGHSDGGGR